MMTPEQAGVDSAAIHRWLERLKELDSMHSFMLLRHGAIIAEGWWAPYNPESPHLLYSLSKSFVSMAVGFAVAEGKLHLTDRLADFFPKQIPADADARHRKVELRHLLTMSSGHAACPAEWIMRLDPVDYAAGWFRTPLAAEPGTRFAYNSAATYMLSRTIREITGMNVSEYLAPRLLDPLEITHREWLKCPLGCEFGGWGYALNTGEIARFAECLRCGGKWQGFQLIPPGYLAAATAFQIDNSATGKLDWSVGYGYQFWRSLHGAYRGDGAFGQFALVMPEQEAVLAATGGLKNMQDVLSITWETLLPAFQNAPLPPNPAVCAALRADCEALALPIAAGAAGSGAENAAGRYALETNEIGFRDAEFRFFPDRCEISLNGETLRAGYGKRIDNCVRWDAPAPRAVAASAGWTAPGVELEIELSYYTTPFNHRLHCRFTPGGVEMVHRSNLLFLTREWPVLHGRTAPLPQRKEMR